LEVFGGIRRLRSSNVEGRDDEVSSVGGWLYFLAKFATQFRRFQFCLAITCWGWRPGRPDEFEKKTAQNAAQYILVEINA
jgi:hypothetical protein